MKKFFTFSQHVQAVFENEDNYEAVRNLMFDLASGEDIYDAEGNKVTKKEANDKLREYARKIFEIDETSTRRDRKRAYEKHSREWFSIIEEVIDRKINTGFTENEFFEQFVDRRNLAMGDDYDFIAESPIYLNVAKVSGQHHDFVLQTYGEGQHYTVPTSAYGGAVGAAIDRYLVGQEDWGKLVGKLAEAFSIKLLNETYAATMDAYKKMPQQPQFVGNGALSSATKANFDEIIENVQMSNGTPVIIMGTNTALKKLNDLADVRWASDSQKEDITALGRLGSYEGTQLVEIPQRFAPGDVTRKLVDSKVLLIMPLVDDNKFVKIVDSGEVEINEVTEKGEKNGRYDDIMKYEMTREFGVSVVLTRNFGYWRLP